MSAAARAPPGAPGVVAPLRAALAPRGQVQGCGRGRRPRGACAAEIFAEEKNIETYIIERKMDNAKPCGGAIPLCMVDEFDLPLNIIDRQVRRMKMISPTNREVDIGQTLKPNEWIGMTRREVMDGFLRDRAIEKGAIPINALVTSIDVPTTDAGKYVLHYTRNDMERGVPGAKETLEVDIVVGGDGANSRVAKAIDAGEYNYAIAFQERVKIDDEKMALRRASPERVGDVSPYCGLGLPEYDHVGVGTGTVVAARASRCTRTPSAAGDKIAGGKVIKVEHPHPRAPPAAAAQALRHARGRAAGYVTKCSGEGIYFARRAAWPARPSSRPWPAARSSRPRRSSRPH